MGGWLNLNIVMALASLELINIVIALALLEPVNSSFDFGTSGRKLSRKVCVQNKKTQNNN